MRGKVGTREACPWDKHGRSQERLFLIGVSDLKTPGTPWGPRSRSWVPLGPYCSQTNPSDSHLKGSILIVPTSWPLWPVEKGLQSHGCDFRAWCQWESSSNNRTPSWQPVSRKSCLFLPTAFNRQKQRSGRLRNFGSCARAEGPGSGCPCVPTPSGRAPRSC